MSLGLPLDTADVLSLPPSVTIYGSPGLGKTTLAALSFPGVLYVQSSPTILHAFAHYASLHPELKLQVPERFTLDEKTVGTYYGGSYYMALVSLLERYIAACDTNKSPYTGIVFDEWNTICERLFAELKADPWGKFKGRSGAINIFAVFDAFKQIHRSVLSLSRRTRKIVGFVSHYQGPKLDEDENSPTKGSIKWPGGPKMPMGLSDQVVELCAESDVVLQMVVKDPASGALMVSSEAQAQPQQQGVRRILMTQADPKWFRKVRGFGIEAEEPVDINKGQGLRELLARAGFPV